MALSAAEEEARYKAQMGQEALDRQKREKKVRCSYCGALGNQHLNLCKNKKRR